LGLTRIAIWENRLKQAENVLWCFTKWKLFL
jgi:hypothetical protein